MKYLFLTCLACFSFVCFAIPDRKTCSCYSGWSCYTNSNGGSYCTNTGFSWYQSASQSCSSARAFDGTVSWAAYDTYSSGPGQAYSSVQMYDSGSGGTGADVFC